MKYERRTELLKEWIEDDLEGSFDLFCESMEGMSVDKKIVLKYALMTEFDLHTIGLIGQQQQYRTSEGNVRWFRLREGEEDYEVTDEWKHGAELQFVGKGPLNVEVTVHGRGYVEQALACIDEDGKYWLSEIEFDRIMNG